MDARGAAEMLEGTVAAYHRADWEHWISCYAEDAQLFYNTTSVPMSPREAAQLHAASVGTVQATFYGLWLATFRATEAAR